LSSAFLYVFCSLAPRIQSRSFAIGHAIGARCAKFYKVGKASRKEWEIPKRYIIVRTRGAHLAPMAKP
jgi:hypothetical protein